MICAAPAPAHADDSTAALTWLAQYAESRRISSGHHVDLGTDDRGNVHLASFATDSAGIDYPRVIRITPDAEAEYRRMERGERGERAGRTTALAATGDGNVWIAGFVTGESSGDYAGFLALLNGSGETVLSIPFEGQSLLYDVASNARGEVLAIGESNGPVHVGGQAESSRRAHTIGAAGESGYFAAKLNAGHEVEWIVPLDGRPAEAAGDTQGNWYVRGAFRESMVAGTDTFTTLGPFDQDGFVMRIGPAGAIDGAWQYGSKLDGLKGRRTADSVDDLIVLANGNTVVAMKSESASEAGGRRVHLAILERDPAGALVRGLPFGDPVADLPVRIARGSDGVLSISYGVFQESDGDSTTTLVIAEIDSAWSAAKYREIFVASRGSAIRALAVHERTLYFAGHYQGGLRRLQTGAKMRIESGHGLFVGKLVSRP